MGNANIIFRINSVSYTHLRAHETSAHLVCRLLLEKKILQVGIRSGTKKEFEIMHNNKQLVNFCPGGNANELKQALIPYAKSPIYLTIDLDWFDPSLLAGTGTPEPGGFFWNDFEEILKTLKDLRIVGSDIVELSPEIDRSGVSSIVAAKVLRSLILSLENMQ